MGDFDDGYVRVPVDVPGVGPVLHLSRSGKFRRSGSCGDMSEAEVSQDRMARAIDEVALGDMLGVER